MRLFHRTGSSSAILQSGFRDAEDRYMTSSLHRGVWFSNLVLDAQEGAHGDDVLEIHLPDELAAEYEWIEEGKTYREFLIPAALVNRFGPPRLMSPAEIDAVDDPPFRLGTLPGDSTKSIYES